MTRICIRRLTIIGSDKGLLPSRRQAIIWTNDGILLIQTLVTNISEILIKIYTYSLKKMHLKLLNGGHFVLPSMGNPLQACPVHIIVIHIMGIHLWLVKWIPLTNGQWCGKYFHVMTDSCHGKSGSQTANMQVKHYLCVHICGLYLYQVNTVWD